jgi:hypothetical protein
VHVLERLTGKPEFIGSSIGIVPINAFMHGNRASSVMFVEPKGFSVVG